ncbi:TetR family transcriptional regulator [soil metagenome]
MPSPTAVSPTLAAEPVDDGDAAPTRRERKAASTRQAIVASARRLFEDHGYAETTVDQIAEHADVAPRTFFRYFPTKEALLFADFDEERARMLDSLQNRPRDEDPLQSIAIVIGRFAEVILERRDDLAWGYRMCSEQDAQEMYERSMLKRQTHIQIAEFLSDRLGADIETDPRPMAWAMAVMGVFGVVIRQGSSESADANPPDAEAVHKAFRDTLESTAAALTTVAEFTGR